MSRVRLDAMSDTGLVSVLPVTAFLALALLTASFVAGLRRPEPSTALVVLHLLALVAMIHATPAALYGTLRYSWAWKHVGIVDRIQVRGNLDPTLDAFEPYLRWPGFFALNALITTLAGRESALAFASWAPVFFNLLAGGAFVLIARSLTDDRRTVWLAVWLYFLANWVGQDYFSPQAMNYGLFLVAIGICLRWFGPDRSPNGGWAGAAGRHAGLLATVLLLLTAIVCSHQLTPFMALSALTLLVMWRWCVLRSLPLLLALAIAAWLIYVATAFFAGNLVELVTSIGRPDNASGTLISLADASPGQVLVAWMDRALTAAVWLLAGLGAARLWLGRRWDARPVLLMAAPFPLVVANSYGGEMLFRVFLFSAPFAAFLAATFLVPRAGSVATRRWCVAVFTVSCLLLAGFLFAYYGKERMYRFTRGETAAAAYLYDTAPYGSRLVAITSNFPWGYREYDKFTYLWLGLEPPESRARLVADPVDIIAGALADDRFERSYLILTRSQAAQMDMTGLLPAGSVGGIERALLASDRFTVAYRTADATVFTLREEP